MRWRTCAMPATISSTKAIRCSRAFAADASVSGSFSMFPSFERRPLPPVWFAMQKKGPLLI